MLSSLSDSGRKVLRERPGWIRKVNREVERMGAKVRSQWAVLGPYDFVTVLEAPDNETVSRVSIELGARGSVQMEERRVGKEGRCVTGVQRCALPILGSLSDSGRKVLRERPGWIRKVNREVERMGAKVRSQWAVLGPYDFVTVLEAPDNETVSRVSIELGARGSV